MPGGLDPDAKPRGAGSITIFEVETGGPGTGFCQTVAVDGFKIPLTGCSWQTGSSTGSLYAIPDVTTAMLAGTRPAGISVPELAAIMREMRSDLERAR